jgi:hypothetical protein
MIKWALILAFATWRVTSLLYIEAPFAWLRKWIGIFEDDETGTMSYPCNLLGEIWECFWCLSLVVSFVLVLFCYILTDLNIFEALVVWLASAGGALVLDVRYFARLRG